MRWSSGCAATLWPNLLTGAQYAHLQATLDAVQAHLTNAAAAKRCATSLTS
jgi:hypothetical protein